MSRSHLFKICLREPIAVLDRVVPQDGLAAEWPADAVLGCNVGVGRGEISRIVREDTILVQAVLPVPPALITGVLDAVCTRVLDLALELEQVDPGIGRPGLPDEITAEAEGALNVYFLGPVAGAAIGMNIAQTVTVNLPGPCDEAGLLALPRRRRHPAT
jgi:hypothetical protein